MLINYEVYGKALCGETVCAIGFFDGCHLGHQKLFEKLNNISNYRQKVAITFAPHPIEYFNKDLSPMLIQTKEQRVRKILSFNIDTVILVKFDECIANTDAKDFIKEFLVEKLNAKGICIGFNFKFGAKRSGTPEILKSLEQKYNYVTYVEDAVMFDELPISSTRVRSAIHEGHMTITKKLLGDYFTLKGKVVNGREVGRSLGFPTANLECDKKQILPPWGVYVTYAEINGKKYFGGCNIGIKPTFGLHYVSIEVHFINMIPDMDLYGKEINLTFVKKIRDEIEFPNSKALIDRIKKDMDIIQEYANK